MKPRTLTLTALAAVLAGGIALAQEGMGGMDHSAHMAPELAGNPAVQGYTAAMDKMMADMMIPYTGDADVDFVRGMIPHHQGAIDMAKIVLEHGKDPEIRKLAEEVIAAQEGEIAMMKSWLVARGK